MDRRTLLHIGAGSALGIIATLTVYRGGKTIETREAVTA